MTIHNLAVCLAPSIFHDVINPNISFPSVSKSHESTSKKPTLTLLTPYRKNCSISSNSNSSKENNNNNNNAFTKTTTHINTINVFKEIKLKLSNSGDRDSSKNQSTCEIKDNLLNGGVGLDGQKDSKISIPKLVEFLSYMIHFREEIFEFEDEIEDLTVED